MTPRTKGRYQERVYVVVTEEEKMIWQLCAGEEPMAVWIRKLINAITMIDYKMPVSGQDEEILHHVYRNPIWDVELLPPEIGKKLAALQLERLQALKKRDSMNGVPTCGYSKLPKFLCDCSSCDPHNRHVVAKKYYRERYQLKKAEQEQNEQTKQST